MQLDIDPLVPKMQRHAKWDRLLEHDCRPGTEMFRTESRN